MNPGDEKNEIHQVRGAARKQPDDTQKEPSSAALNDHGNESGRERDQINRPVRIGREQAEKNIPSDPDPDDPVSP